VAVAWIEEIIRAGSARVEELEVYAVEGRSVSADLKRDQVAHATGSHSAGLSIRTIQSGRIGVSGTNNPAAWQRCLDAAIASGSLSTQQTWEGLPDPVPVDTSPMSFDPHLAIEADAARTLLNGMLEGAARHAVQVTAGSADLSMSTITLANSRGIRYSRRSSHVSISLETIVGQSTGYEFAQSFTMDTDPQEVGEKAAFFAEHSQNGKDITSGIYDLVLSPIAFAQLIGAVVMPALSGRNVHAGRSRLAGEMDQRVMDQRISLSDDPHHPRGLGSTGWDAEGVPAHRLDFIENGILRSFAYDLKTAYRYGKTSTGSAVRSGFGGAPSIGHHNLIISGERSGVKEGRVLYAHDVVGAHTANPMSGDFSVELSNACWMDDGSFGEPIRTAMFAGNVFEMLRSIGGLGDDDRIIGSMILPSIRLNGQHIVGT
jgi:PmbA protein